MDPDIRDTDSPGLKKKHNQLKRKLKHQLRQDGVLLYEEPYTLPDGSVDMDELADLAVVYSEILDDDIDAILNCLELIQVSAVMRLLEQQGIRMSEHFDERSSRTASSLIVKDNADKTPVLHLASDTVITEEAESDSQAGTPASLPPQVLPSQGYAAEIEDFDFPPSPAVRNTEKKSYPQQDDSANFPPPPQVSDTELVLPPTDLIQDEVTGPHHDIVPDAPHSNEFSMLLPSMEDLERKFASSRESSDILHTPVISPVETQAPPSLTKVVSTDMLVPSSGKSFAAFHLIPSSSEAPIVPPRPRATFESNVEISDMDEDRLSDVRSIGRLSIDSQRDTVSPTTETDLEDSQLVMPPPPLNAIKYTTDSDTEYEQDGMPFGFGDSDESDDEESEYEPDTESITDVQSISGASDGNISQTKTIPSVHESTESDDSSAPSVPSTSQSLIPEIPEEQEINILAEKLAKNLSDHMRNANRDNSLKQSPQIHSQSAQALRAPVGIDKPLPPLRLSNSNSNSALEAGPDSFRQSNDKKIQKSNLTPVTVTQGSNKRVADPNQAERVPSMAEAVRRSTSRVSSNLRQNSSKSWSQMGGRVRIRTALSLSKHQTTQVGRKKWSPYYAQIKGNMLLLLRTTHDNSAAVADLHLHDADRSYIIEGCLCQNIEHEGVFNTFAVGLKEGLVLHVMVNDSEIVSKWVRALHSAAALYEGRSTDIQQCAGVLKDKLARHHEALVLARNKNAECQANPTINKHLRNSLLWKFEMELLTTFRLECFLSAIDSDSKSPSQAGMFAEISENTKELLDELGDFCRHCTGLMMVLGPLYAKIRPKAKKPKSLFGRRKSGAAANPNEISMEASPRRLSRKSNRPHTETVEHVDQPTLATKKIESGDSDGWDMARFVRVVTPDGKKIDIPRFPKMRIRELLRQLSGEISGNALTWYLGLERSANALPLLATAIVEQGALYFLHEKPVHDVHITRPPYGSFGFEFTASNGLVMVTQVDPQGAAHYHGLNAGDVIIEINGADTRKDLELAVHQLQSEYQAAMRIIPSNRLAQQTDAALKREIDFSLLLHMVPPPPTITEPLEDLVLPSPGDFGLDYRSNTSNQIPNQKQQQYDLDDSDIDDAIRRLFSDCGETNLLSKEMQATLPSPESGKRKKTWQLQARIYELLDTETAYVGDLDLFIDRFVDPVLAEKCATRREKRILQGCYFHEMIALHQQFAADMNECIESPAAMYRQRADAHLVGGKVPQTRNSGATLPNGTISLLAPIDEGVGDLNGGEATGNLTRHTSNGHQKSNEQLNKTPVRRSSLSVARPPRTPSGAPVTQESYIGVIASLYAVGELFEKRLSNFKHVYSDFIVHQSRAQTVLNAETNSKLKEFLSKRIPGPEITKQIDSYMIKPVQRLTKYPLLLRDIMKDIDKDTKIDKEIKPISSAFDRAMDLATYINEFRNIAQALTVCISVPRMRTMTRRIDAVWLNPFDDRGKSITVKKLAFPELTMLAFEECLIVLRRPGPREYEWLLTIPSSKLDCFAIDTIPGVQKTTIKAFGDKAWVLSNAAPEEGPGPASLPQFVLACSDVESRQGAINAIKESAQRLLSTQTVAV